MTYWITADIPRLKGYIAVHNTLDCPQARRLAHTVAVPDAYLHYFNPCAFCVHTDRWYQDPRPRDGSLNDWYQTAKAAL